MVKIKKSSVFDMIVEAEEILERNVVPIGNGAHINIPKKHIGKNAKVILMKKK